MFPVDLLEHARFNEKISPQHLSCESVPRPVTRYQLVVSHLIDLMVVFCATSVLTLLMRVSLDQFLVSRALRSDSLTSFGPFWGIFAVTFTAYFFTAYFFNHGQTFGSFRLKYRTEVSPWNLTAALRWVLWTAVNYVSLGFVAKRLSWTRAYQQHDYLYRRLLRAGSATPVDLVLRPQVEVEDTLVEKAA